jgi:hypothetical protein
VPVIPDPTSPTTEDLLPAKTTEPVKALKTRTKKVVAPAIEEFEF